MIAEPIDVRRLFGILDTEKSDGDVAAAIEYASQKIAQDSGRQWTGTATREYLGKSDGKRMDYHVGVYPILGAVQISEGVATDDETKITLETRDTVGAYTTVPSTDYTLTGAKGLISFDSDKIPTKGTEIYVTYKYDTYHIRFAESALAAYFLISSMANGQDRAEEIFMRYREAYTRLPVFERFTVI